MPRVSLIPTSPSVIPARFPIKEIQPGPRCNAE
jgi:hypothetical protein